MQKLVRAVRLSLIYVAALLLAASNPLSAMAETADISQVVANTVSPETKPPTTGSEIAAVPLLVDAAQTPSATPPAATSSAGTPSDSPASDKPAQPKEKYAYNPATGRWDSDRWQYNPATGVYERPSQPQTVKAAPQTAAVISPSTPSPIAVIDNNAQQTASTTIDDTTKNEVANAINSGALSGDAAVIGNTAAGSATTGNASAAATIINNVNSTVANDSNQKAASFVSNIMGDVSGDIMLQPMLLKAMLEAGTGVSPQGAATVTTTNQLTNTINLNATSGDAAVKGNTAAGNATSGDANTVASVLNIVNSMISANRSFVGTINIYGNLDGDILIAPDFIPQMIASNGTDASAKNASAKSAAGASISSKDTTSIVNNVALAAQSGQAAVSGNTEAGSATTGSADTNVVIFNLSGHQIVASNSLLVFVNVLGKWVGVIVDAPTGSTAAVIGNGVIASESVTPDLVVDATTKTLLTNNINLTSLSGDATVARNTRAGNATTGNATASANIGNIVGTQMGLSDWFGVLFINVFGSWNGSFGINTAAGNRVATSGGGSQPNSSQIGTRPMRVIEFVPKNAMSADYSRNQSITLITNDDDGDFTATEVGDQSQTKVTSATKNSNPTDSDSFAALSPAGTQSAFQLPWLGIAVFTTGLSLVVANTLSDARKREESLRSKA